MVVIFKPLNFGMVCSVMKDSRSDSVIPTGPQVNGSDFKMGFLTFVSLQPQFLKISRLHILEMIRTESQMSRS